MNSQTNTIPFFSIITPTYNRSQSISKAIDSVLVQDFSDWEYIIVDDGSTDDTAQIVEKYAADDERIKYFPLPKNQGVSTARNEGMKIAKGKYMLFLDSDDGYELGAFSLMHKFLCKDNEIDMVIFPIESINENTDFTKLPNEENYRVLEQKEIRGKFLPGLLGVCSHEKDHIYRPVVINKCIPKNILTDNNIFFDTEKVTWEDGEVFIKLVDKCKKIVAIDDPLMGDRTMVVDDHLSMKYYPEGMKNTLDEYKWYLNYFGKEFDFFNDFAMDYHFNQMQIWIYRTLSKDKNRKELLFEILKDEDFIKLVTKRKAQGKFEVAVQKALAKGKTARAYNIYLFQNFINRGKCF